MTRAALALALIAAMAGTAWPCPGPPPDDDGTWRCAKYDHMYPELTAVPAVQVYVRDRRGTLPRGKKKVMKYLTSSGWHARRDQGVVDNLQVFDAANVPDTYEAMEGARQTFIRDLAKEDHQYRVTLDDGVFLVMRCKERGHARTCLVRE